MLYHSRLLRATRPPRMRPGSSSVCLWPRLRAQATEEHAVPRHAAPCCAMLRHAAPCCAMRRHAAPCCAMLCYITLCQATLHDAVSGYARLRQATPGCATLATIALPQVFLHTSPARIALRLGAPRPADASVRAAGGPSDGRAPTCSAPGGGAPGRS